MKQTKPYNISKELIFRAYKLVKANKGSYGVDKQSLKLFDADLENNLYKLWNRLSSGSYFPKPVRRVEIEKVGGGSRPLGIPTVTDRIAQTAVKLLIEPDLEKIFHKDSYGYRPNRSPHHALNRAKERCWERPWALDLDIKSFFDTIPHDLLMKAVRKHVKVSWQLLYIKRWLECPVQLPDGSIKESTKGTPQGGVISPLLANLFLHYCFDVWIEKRWKGILFERFADDIVCHCITLKQTNALKSVLQQRFRSCGLEMHPEKTKVVYCKSHRNKEEYENISFDFLGYTFRPRLIRSKGKRWMVSFLPAISLKASKRLRRLINDWPWRKWFFRELEDILGFAKSKIAGWLHYFGYCGKGIIREVLFHFDHKLAIWAFKKYKKLKTKTQAFKRVSEYRKRYRYYLAHWNRGVLKV